MFGFFKKKPTSSELLNFKKDEPEEIELPIFEQLKVHIGALMKMQLTLAGINSKNDDVCDVIMKDDWSIGYVKGVGLSSLMNSSLNPDNDPTIWSDYIYSLFDICFGAEHVRTVFDHLRELETEMPAEFTNGYKVGVDDFSEWLKGEEGNGGLVSLAERFSASVP